MSVFITFKKSDLYFQNKFTEVDKQLFTNNVSTK